MASSLVELGGQLVCMAGKLLSLLACEYSATNKAKAKGSSLLQASTCWRSLLLVAVFDDSIQINSVGALMC